MPHKVGNHVELTETQQQIQPRSADEVKYYQLRKKYLAKKAIIIEEDPFVGGFRKTHGSLFGQAGDLAKVGIWDIACERMIDSIALLEHKLGKDRVKNGHLPDMMSSEELSTHFTVKRSLFSSKAKKVSDTLKGLLDRYEEWFTSYRPCSVSALGENLTTGIETLKAVEKEITTYMDKLPPDHANSELVVTLKRYARKQRVSLEAIRADRELYGDATLNEAMMLQRARIDPGEVYVSGDREPFEKELLGSGAVNSVYKMTDKQGVTAVFKPDPGIDPSGAVVQREAGIPIGDPKYTERNIATRKLAEMLGVGNLVTDAKHFIHEGELGLLMSMAPGRTLRNTGYLELSDEEAEQFEERIQKRREEEGDEGAQKFMELSRLHRGRGGKLYRRKTVLEKPDFGESGARKQSYMKKMLQLQALDALCGQLDRHNLNYLIDFSGDECIVTGIDNDFSFGKKVLSPDRMNADRAFPEAVHLPGFPALIDEDLAASIEALDFDEFDRTLIGKLSLDEQQAMRSRFAATKQKIQQMRAEGRVVADWDTHRVNGMSAMEYLLSEDAPKSYFKRDMEDIEKNGVDPERVHRELPV